MNHNRLDDQIALITGAGRGIGRATALLLANAGAAVVATARTRSEINDTVDLIRTNGGRAIAVPADISDWSQIQNLQVQTEKEFGPATLVIANASILEPVALSWDVDPEAWTKNIQVNLIGTFFTVRAFLPAMVTNRKGLFVFVSSGAASNTVPGWGAYCASKAGVNHYAKNLAAELTLKEIPIQIHILSPGIVDTSMQRTIRESTEDDFPQVKRFVKFKATRKLRAPDEPAQVIWWMASGHAADLHGEVVSIDDENIRSRVASNLNLPLLPGR
jgi:NAD(P)-dependent dehydrogenase (short-subunit alcohol dehydrogenase family)